MKIEVFHNGRVFRIPKTYFILCQGVKQRPDFAELEEEHRTRTQQHIQNVVEYSTRFRILSRQFENHDADKLNKSSVVYIPYVLNTLKHTDEERLNKYEKLLTEIGSFIHVKSNPHHPEYWDQNVTYVNHVREKVKRVTNGSTMSEFALMEMCCDWCAMSKELGGTPFDWFEKNKGKRWEFTDVQISMIQHNLERSWGDGLGRSEWNPPEWSPPKI